NFFRGKSVGNVAAGSGLDIRYNPSRYTGVNQENAGPSSALEHTGDNQVNTDNVAVDYTKILGTMVWDSRFNFVRDNEPGLANGSGPEVAITGGLTFGKNNFSPRY